MFGLFKLNGPNDQTQYWNNPSKHVFHDISASKIMKNILLTKCKCGQQFWSLNVKIIMWEKVRNL